NTRGAFGFEYETLSEHDLQSMSIKSLHSKCQSRPLVILGGLGFSGYEKKFNANMGIYRNAITNILDDMSFTKRFEKIYEKLKEALSDRTVIVFTHMPKSNWSIDAYQHNWIYVSGHTHRNYF